MATGGIISHIQKLSHSLKVTLVRTGTERRPTGIIFVLYVFQRQVSTVCAGRRSNVLKSSENHVSKKDIMHRRYTAETHMIAGMCSQNNVLPSGRCDTTP